MLLREYQQRFVERSIDALKKHGNSLGVAIVAAGKTLMLSSVIGKLHKQGYPKACVLAHRDELTEQNAAKFLRVNPDLHVSFVDAKRKSWDGDATFAMVQTLSRDTALETMPKIDLLVIDEAHHVVANSYRRIINRARELNPDCLIYGVTATPSRGDKQGLRDIFTNIADKVSMRELIRLGYLVKPRCFVIDVGVKEELQQVKKLAADYDMGEVEQIMNKRPVTEAVIQHWIEHAGDRKTIVFCSTVDHAIDVHEAFINADIKAELLHGSLSSTDRKQALANYEQGDTQVIINVAILTEGYDYTPTSCVVLLRPSSYRSTMIQMVGRGLRVVDPNEFPGVIKKDCIILDFGTSTLTHGSLEQEITLEPTKKRQESESKDSTKVCPECYAIVPANSNECELCGYDWLAEIEEEQEEPESFATPETLRDFTMTEIDLLKRSSFLWRDLFGKDNAFIATGFNAWGGVFLHEDNWYAIGGAKGEEPRLLTIGERMVCLATADDWLNDHETEDAAHKTKRWLNQPATDKQRQLLPQQYKMDFGLTRYHASTLVTFEFNKKKIQELVLSQQAKEIAA